MTQLTGRYMLPPGTEGYVLKTVGGDIAWARLNQEFLQILDFPCLTTVEPLHWVYISLGVAHSANALDLVTSNVIGIVSNKPTTTTADILLRGLSPAMFSGLVSGQLYFLDTLSGNMSLNYPSAPGSVVVTLGTAITATQMLISPQVQVIKAP